MGLQADEVKGRTVLIAVVVMDGILPAGGAVFGFWPPNKNNFLGGLSVTCPPSAAWLGDGGMLSN